MTAFKRGYADGYAMRDHAQEGADQYSDWVDYSPLERAQYSKGYYTGILERNQADQAACKAAR